MQLTVYTKEGSDAGRTVDLDDAVFGVEPNDHAIWLDVRAIQAHKRQGTHKTKERGEVSKSRRKLYRQKGTGNARAGDAKSPLRKGGGTIFGPKPHEYRLNVNKKTKQLARRSALRYKLDGDALRIVEDVRLEVPKTREVAGMLSGNGATGKTLILTNGLDDVFYRSARNLKGVTVRPVGEASTLDLLNAKMVVLQEGAIDALTDALRPATKATTDDLASTPPTDLPVPMDAAPTTPSPEAPAVPTTEPLATDAGTTETTASEAPVAPAEPVINTPDPAEPVAPAEPVIDTDAADESPDVDDAPATNDSDDTEPTN